MVNQTVEITIDSRMISSGYLPLQTSSAKLVDRFCGPINVRKSAKENHLVGANGILFPMNVGNGLAFGMHSFSLVHTDLTEPQNFTHTQQYAGYYEHITLHIGNK
jgi:hypothetical protein